VGVFYSLRGLIALHRRSLLPLYCVSVSIPAQKGRQLLLAAFTLGRRETTDAALWANSPHTESFSPRGDPGRLGTASFADNPPVPQCRG